ncbi:MAG: carboxypeptidase regulatory-like domain-containing protein [Cyclobacteriaceae bacterium]|nr:carboxypeptidase regulatory-like domain-containing protein [Cyclobacteriaceae bacterium]MCH8514849.1 carboxypeptidase regulatory-like domain-containing protein [Cyclobacteriaceae bacterium]
MATLFPFASQAQLLNTSLEITIRNETGNTVEGATVRIYETEEDYNNKKHELQQAQLTDKKGRITFRQLGGEKTYFIHAEKDDRDNYTLGTQTEPLKKGRKNKTTIIIE